MTNEANSGDGNIAVHLVLSSGGMKCLSYAGAIAALCENGISFASISGSSAGSLIGAILSSKVGMEGLQRAVYEIDPQTLGEGTSRLRFLNLLANKPYATFTTSRVAERFRSIVGYDPKFEELEIPFATFGVDLRSHKIHVYSSKVTPKMAVSEALRISTAAPFLFPPQKEQEKLLLDGAVVSQSPVWLATTNDDDLPILVLRPKKDLAVPAAQGLQEYIASLIDLGGGSRDSYLINDIPRARLIEIDSGSIKWNSLTLPEESKKALVASGRASVESRLKDLKELLRNTQPAKPRGIAHDDDDDVTARAGTAAIASLVGSLPPKREQVFISYSHKDSKWLYKVQEALNAGGASNRALNLWDDSKIPPGARWREEIRKALASAKVAVLLVSLRFLASEFIRDVELQAFLQASESSGLKILPVAVGHSDYQATPLKEYQFLNNPERPLMELDEAEQDKEMVSIGRKIIGALES